MSDAIERLVDAWTSVAKTVTDLVVSHHDSHASGELSGKKKSGRREFTFTPDQSCEPSSTGHTGEVRVGVKTPPSPVALGTCTVTRHVAGQQPDLSAVFVSPKHQLDVQSSIGPNDASVLVRLPPGTTDRGLYAGSLVDDAGLPVAPVIIYLHGVTLHP